MNKNGFIIALAYPDVFVPLTEGNYYWFLRLIGIIKGNSVCAGHAAMMLVHPESGALTYTDFGRYITPIGKGRARSKWTDPEVEIKINAKIVNGKITNLNEILFYLNRLSDVTHGYGKLYASVFKNINYDAALADIKNRSLLGSIKYGPFVWNGSNCSRHIWSLIYKHTKEKLIKWKLIWNYPPATMPLNNLHAAKEVFELFEGRIKRIRFTRIKIWLTLLRRRKDPLPQKETSKCDRGTVLAGKGSSSEFELIKRLGDREYLIRRIDPVLGEVFCHSFICDNGFDEDKAFSFVFDCHAAACTVLQDGRKITMKRKVVHLTCIKGGRTIQSLKTLLISYVISIFSK